MAEKKKEVADDDVLALLGDEVHQATKSWQLTSLQAGRPQTSGPPNPRKGLKKKRCRSCVHSVYMGGAERWQLTTLRAGFPHPMVHQTPLGCAVAPLCTRSCMACPALAAETSVCKGSAVLRGCQRPWRVLVQIANMLCESMQACAGGLRHHGPADGHGADAGP